MRRGVGGDKNGAASGSVWTPQDACGNHRVFDNWKSREPPPDDAIAGLQTAWQSTFWRRHPNDCGRDRRFHFSPSDQRPENTGRSRQFVHHDQTEILRLSQGLL